MLPLIEKVNSILSCRISEDLDLYHLLERLLQGKGQPNTLTQSEKLDLWGRLKILSFTRMALSVWATVMLSLYTKVQVNILGRHLYIDTARRFESSNLLTIFQDSNPFDKNEVKNAQERCVKMILEHIEANTCG